MRAPSIPKNRSSSFPSREFLSSLVLPAPSVLEEYLCPRSCGSGGSGCHSDENVNNMAAALRENKLLWFTTKGILCWWCPLVAPVIVPVHVYVICVYMYVHVLINITCV